MSKKIPFLYGLGQNKSQYKELSKFCDVKKIDWNNGSLAKLKLGKPDTLIGFSLGAIVACDHAIKYKVKKLILCSMTPGVETLKDVKADNIVFLVGEKEILVLKEIRRVSKTLTCQWNIIVIPKADHKIKGNYLKQLIDLVK